MSYEMSVKVGVTTAYFILLMGIGVITSRFIEDIKDYFAAGKGLGYWLVSFSSRASGESGWLILGLTGMGFAVGLHAFWITLGEVLGVLIAWLFLVQRFKLFTDRYDSITIPDYLEDRFHDLNNIIRVISALVLSVFVTMYVAGQYVAAGKAFKGFMGMDMTTGIVVGMGIVIFYSVAGGLVAVVWSDLIQGILMFFGLTLVPLTALFYLGGPTGLFNALRSVDPVYLAISGSPEEWGAKTILSILGLISIGWGFLGSPQLFVRFLAVKNNQELVNGSLVAVLFTIFTDAGAVVTGMCGRVLYENLDWIGMFYGMVDREMVYPLMVEDLFPLWISAFFLAVVLAAIMSTADSLLVVAASAVVRDIYQKIFRPEASQKWLTVLSRLLTLTLSLLALAFALWQGAPKFNVERRNSPLNKLKYAGKASFPNNTKAQFAQLDKTGLNKRWVPSVRSGLKELKHNLLSEKKKLFELKKRQIKRIKETDLSEFQPVLTNSARGRTSQMKARRDLEKKLDKQVTRVGEIFHYNPDSTFQSELKELKKDLPEASQTKQWETWFGQYQNIVHEAIVKKLNSDHKQILKRHVREYDSLLSRLRNVKDSFRSLLNENGDVMRGLTSVEIRSVQEDLTTLAQEARDFYPTSALKMETTPAVFWFILIGWAGIASAFCPVIILSLYWERMTKWGAISGMVTAFVVVSVWKFMPIGYAYYIPGIQSLVSWLGFDPMALNTLNDTIYMMVPGFVSAFIAIFVVSLLTDPPEDSREDMEFIREQSVDFWEVAGDE
ncbi:MAG: sodium/solute symporter [bacterium]